MNAFDDNADGDNSVFFDKEVIAPLVSGIVNDILIKETYDDAKTQVLIDQICGRSMAALADLQLGMKFVSSCIIVQNKGVLTSQNTKFPFFLFTSLLGVF